MVTDRQFRYMRDEEKTDIMTDGGRMYDSGYRMRLA